MNSEEAENQLKEGAEYDFTICKTTTLPNSQEVFYVLADPFGTKHLLKADYYQAYQFYQGQKIRCRVDKINCSGKRFLEPEHPIYQVGQEYLFRIQSVDYSQPTGKGVPAIVLDQLGQQANAVINRRYANQSTQSVPLKLIRIKKGKLYLADATISGSDRSLDQGASYLFEITAKEQLADAETYFLLRDPYDEMHFLPARYYGGYGLQIGKTVSCRVVKFSSKGFYLLEPEHPCYQLGKRYFFRFLRSEKLPQTTGNSVCKLVLEDCLGRELISFLAPEQLPPGGFKKPIQGRVDKIKKGKVYISDLVFK